MAIATKKKNVQIDKNVAVTSHFLPQGDAQRALLEDSDSSKEALFLSSSPFRTKGSELFWLWSALCPRFILSQFIAEEKKIIPIIKARQMCFLSARNKSGVGGGPVCLQWVLTISPNALSWGAQNMVRGEDLACRV